MKQEKRTERENKIDEKANKIIRNEENIMGRKLTQEEVVECYKVAEIEVDKLEKKERKESKKQQRRNKMKKRIFAVLAALGITIGGANALLNSGEEKIPQEPTGIETDNDTEKSSTKREEYLQELKEGVEEIKEVIEDEDLYNEINEILEQYNIKLESENQITEENLGIIYRNNVGDAHITVDSENNYVENPLRQGDLPEGVEWIPAEDIGEEYILVDTKNNKTIAGIGEINHEKTEIIAEYADFGGKEYTKDDITYVGIPEGTNLEEVYEDFGEYYQYRTEKQQNQEKQNDGFEH